MLAWLANLLSGPIIGSLLKAYQARLDANNSQDAKALELLKAEIEAETAARAEATKLLIAEQGHWYTAMIRPLFAIPFIIYAFKIVVWDKVLGLGTTLHGIDANFWSVFKVIVVSYFGATAAERVTRIFKRQ
jgi:hypothetical protein